MPPAGLHAWTYRGGRAALLCFRWYCQTHGRRISAGSYGTFQPSTAKPCYRSLSKQISPPQSGMACQYVTVPAGECKFCPSGERTAAPSLARRGCRPHLYRWRQIHERSNHNPATCAGTCTTSAQRPRQWSHHPSRTRCRCHRPIRLDVLGCLPLCPHKPRRRKGATTAPVELFACATIRARLRVHSR